MQCHLSDYQNKASKKAERLLTPREAANQQSALSSGRPAHTPREKTKVVLLSHIVKLGRSKSSQGFNLEVRTC